MSNEKPKNGQLYWTDMTVDNPAEVKEFYKQIFGWHEMEVPMKDGDESYVDYGMAVDPSTAAGGICHNRGKNKGIPPQWISYFYIDDVEKALQTCIELGGELLKENRKKDGTLSFAIVKDPQGAVFGMGNLT
ncbi:VOC family protein [Sphingobacterium litopenaei]|uniref:VOC family protein n=1 Tax=Sphingobacterium litopenaei TaxID=2763500 RepID=A0ABR7YH82_9SPHI|nr:VOC family protein [Sphingobacterium litopenaei]MBD1430621.1 VOC family protein [Sphingobacterium litopenaei]